jgi:predicted dinucleotide-binding enzyme
MQVGIIGAGEVGQTLGKAFLSEGHAVMLASRDAHKPELAQWQKNNPKGQTGSFRDAAKFGDWLVLCVAGAAAEEACQLAGIENLSGKIIMDTTNPIEKAPPVNGVLKFFTTLEDSLMERLQRLAPEAKFVKTWNSVGSDFMYKPAFPGGTPSMFICGNDGAAKQTVTSILTAFGWETEDMGQVEAARAIEPLCLLWCIPGFIRNQWTHAFKLLKM